MNKIAQRRGFFNKVREKLNAPEETISGAFSPEFTQLMDTLREVDDEAREHAVDLKDMLKTARSSFNRREYMSAISYLGKFHERLELIRWQFIKLSKSSDMIHNQFLFGDLDSEHKKNLFENMPERYKPKAKVPVKKAGLKDWWENTFPNSDRSKSLKFWEKRFPKAAKEIKRQTEKMLNRSEMFLNVLMNTFKALATFRATRKLEEYIGVSSAWVQKYDNYDDAFNEYFNGSVKKFIDSQKEFEAKKKEKDAEIEGQRNRPMEGGGHGEGSSPDSESDRPTDEFKKEKSVNPTDGGETPIKSVKNEPLDPREQDRKDVERAIKEELNGPAPWPEKGEPFTLREGPSTTRESEPSTPRPPSGNRVKPLPQLLPAGEEPVPGTLNQGPVSGVWQDNLVKNVITTDPDALPTTPTMISPVPPANPPAHRSLVPPMSIMPGSIYDQPIPRGGKIPDLAELSKPPTASELKTFKYYEPPVVKPPTVRPGRFNAPQAPKPKLELVDVTGVPSSIPEKIPATASEFIEKITKLADQNPLIIAKEIIVFAKSIELTDKATSDRLLMVAKNLLK